jgi:hypothetical protein
MTITKQGKEKITEHLTMMSHQTVTQFLLVDIFNQSNKC